MKTRVLIPFLALTGLVLAVGLACGTTPVVTQPTNPPPVVVQPTTPPATLAPEATALSEWKSGDVYYSTTFSDLADWEKYYHNDKSTYTIENRSDGLHIKIPAAKDYVLLYHDPGPGSSNVRLEADVELIAGTNYTYFYLICRASKQAEYDFILDTGGYWQIGKYVDQKYTRLYDGGSTSIKVAKAKNHMTAICQDSSLTFEINGVQMTSVTDSSLTEGAIGVEVDTLDYPHSEVVIHNFQAVIP
jgi:hypothetical protein